MDTLIFSASVGAGHDQAARALREEILRRYPAARVAVVDTISYISPMLNKLVLEGYLGLLKLSPRVYGKLYEKTEGGDNGADLAHWPYRLLSGALTKVIRSYAPDAIICTHAFATGLLGTLKTRQRIRQYLTTVVTDFTVHSYWVHAGNDLYCIAHDELSGLMDDLGVPRSQVVATGIPILSKFEKKLDKKAMRERHGLADLPTILVMGGSLGLGKIKTIVESLDAQAGSWQILVVTGRNEKLHDELKHRHWSNRVHVYGFINFVHELMAAADIVLTKPGGITAAEALSQGKPIVIMSPIPGQEDRNSRFLTEQGCAIRLRADTQVGQKVAQLLADEEGLAALGQRAAQLARPFAAAAIVDQVEARVRNY
ncbi:MAG: glycosyltransferase [Firmicutes bacterium]|nr:glycosyltransferase [Bacillota bacterium]